MSVTVSTRVWGQSAHTDASKKLLLLALADHADESGVCWPGDDLLSTKLHVTPRHIRRLLREIEESGELVTFEGRGRGIKTIFLVAVGQTTQQLAETIATHERLADRYQESPIAIARAATRQMQRFCQEKGTSPHEVDKKGTSGHTKRGHPRTKKGTFRHTRIFNRNIRGITRKNLLLPLPPLW